MQEQHAQGGAALPRTLEAGCHHIAHYLLGQCGGVDDHTVLAAGFGNQGDRSVAALGQLAREPVARCGGTREHDSFYSQVGDQLLPYGAPFGDQQGDGALGKATRRHQIHGAPGNQAGLFCGFGNYRVARRQRGTDLADENRQGEVPGADTKHHAARLQAMLGKAGLHSARGVITQEIHGFAHFRDTIAQCFTRFLAAQCDQLIAVGLQGICQPLQALCAFIHGQRGPLGEPRMGERQRGLDASGIGQCDVADHLAVARGVAHFTHATGADGRDG